MTTRREQKEKRRQEILEAALDLFITRGYAETKISDIAERVGMSVGLLFYYFESKAKLYEELIHIGISGPVSVMRLDASDPLVFFERAAGYIFSAIKMSNFVAKMFVLMEQAQLAPNLPESLAAELPDANPLEQTVEIIRRGQEMGQLRPGNPEALGILFWQAVSGVALYVAVRPDAPMPETEWIIDCIRRKPE